MAAPCPRCGSEIRDSEVAEVPGDQEDYRQVATCLCCGVQLARAAEAASWEPNG